MLACFVMASSVVCWRSEMAACKAGDGAAAGWDAGSASVEACACKERSQQLREDRIFTHQVTLGLSEQFMHSHTMPTSACCYAAVLDAKRGLQGLPHYGGAEGRRGSALLLLRWPWRQQNPAGCHAEALPKWGLQPVVWGHAQLSHRPEPSIHT